MYGSSASNAYGRGGTEKATGFSSGFEFVSGVLGTLTCKTPGARFVTPQRPAPTILPFTTNSLRFTLAPNERPLAGSLGVYRRPQHSLNQTVPRHVADSARLLLMHKAPC